VLTGDRHWLTLCTHGLALQLYFRDPASTF